MTQILFNDKLNNYTFNDEVENTKSIKRVPLKFKFDDSTSKYRRDILKEEILKNQKI